MQIPTQTWTANDLPFDALAPDKFEALCLALVRRLVDDQAEHLGAAGADGGYDIRARVDGKVVCYQCKRYKTFQLAHAKKAIDAVIEVEEPPPDEMVLVVPKDLTKDLRTKIVEYCGVPCSFWARTELQDRVRQFPELLKTYFATSPHPTQATQAPLWNIPQGVRFFTGRGVALEKLRQALTDTGQAALGQSLAVSGLGGIGKTQTAIAYAHEYRDAYTFAFWIAAENETTLRASFSEIAGILELPEVHEPEEDRMLAAVLRAWASREGGLLVFDNVEDPDLVKRFTPNPQPHHVVVTSRLQTLRRYGFPILELPVLAPEDAVGFLHGRTGRKIEEGSEEHQAAVDLAEELGYLPLALEQAAAYIDSRAMGFGSYLATYRKAGVEWIDRLEAVDHPESLLKTWNLNLQQVEEESPHSIQLFHILAFLAPEDVPEFLFEDVEGAGQPLEDALTVHDAALDDLLEPLRRFSLIERDRAHASISVHRLVQDVTRLAMANDSQRDALRQAAILLDRSFPDPKSLENWEICEALSAHVRSLQAKSTHWAEDFPEAARLFHGKGTYCIERARFKEAEVFCARSLRIYETALGGGHLYVASAVNNLALVYFSLGQYGEVESLYLRALQIYEAILEKDHIYVANTFNNLALLFKTQGRFAEAEALYLRGLGIEEKVFGDEHPQVANTLNNLASLYCSQGQFLKAEPLFARSLSIRESALGKDHPEIAYTLNNQASLCYSLGRYEKAEPLYLRSLHITEGAFGSEHPGLAKPLMGLAILHVAQGRYPEAETLYLRALEVTRAALGDEHPDLANILHNLALLYWTRGQSEEAEPLYVRSLRMRVAALGEDHPEVAQSLNNLALLYFNEGKYNEAEAMYVRALEIYKRRMGPNHPHTAQFIQNYEDLLNRLGRNEEADALRQEFAQALAVQESPAE